MSVAQSVVFLLIFRYVFGGAITAGGPAYVDYLVPGLLTVSMLFTVMRVGVGVAEDLGAGVTDRLRSLPMPRTAILLGRSLADLAVTAITLAATTAVAFAVGFRPAGGVAGLAALLGVCLATGATFGWVFVVIGLATGSVPAAQGLGFLVLPLSFVSSAYVPTASMPGWLRVFADHQPVTVLVDAARSVSEGGTYHLVAAAVWCAGICAVTIPASVALFRRR